jgi:hypothetical protein
MLACTGVPTSQDKHGPPFAGLHSVNATARHLRALRAVQVTQLCLLKLQGPSMPRGHVYELALAPACLGAV